MTKPSTKDQLEGNLHDLKGKVKQKAGQIANDPNLEPDGQAKKIPEKIKNNLGQVEKVLGL
jgi:uncharacterized protein YjbJ (UPF0337 family)